MSVSIVLIRVLTEAVEAAGVDRDQWLRTAKFDAQRLEDSNGRVEVEEYARLQALAIEMSGDPALGLHLGEGSNYASFDVIAHVTSHAATFRQGFETILRFGAILDEDGMDWTLEENGEAALISRELPRISL